MHKIALGGKNLDFIIRTNEENMMDLHNPRRQSFSELVNVAGGIQ